MSFEKRIAELGLEVPTAFQNPGNFVPAVIHGNLIFASGQTGKREGVLKYQGKLGREVKVEEGYEAARLAMLSCLGELKTVLGSLDRMERILRVTGYVASAPGFHDQPLVINGASDLLLEIFGAAGQHARTAVGVAELPGNAPVEVEVFCALKAGE